MPPTVGTQRGREATLPLRSSSRRTNDMDTAFAPPLASKALYGRGGLAFGEVRTSLDAIRNVVSREWRALGFYYVIVDTLG
jgi:hypothetical protein